MSPIPWSRRFGKIPKEELNDAVGLRTPLCRGSGPPRSRRVGPATCMPLLTIARVSLSARPGFSAPGLVSGARGLSTRGLSQNGYTLSLSLSLSLSGKRTQGSPPCALRASAHPQSTGCLTPFFDF